MVLKNSRQNHPDSWEMEGLYETVNPKFKDPQKQVAQVFAVKILIVACLISLPICALALLNIWMNPVEIDMPPVGQFAIERTLAQRHVEDWLKRTPAPLPGGRIISVDEIETLPAGTTEVEPQDGWPATLKTVWFTLADQNQFLYRAAVEVAVSTDGQDARILSAPSLQRIPDTPNSFNPDNLWYGLAEYTPTDAVGQTVQSWAEAYASADPLKLKQAVGDPDPAAFYQPLAGVAQISATPKRGAYLAGATDPVLAAVNIEMTILWAGQTIDPNGGQLEPSISLDVLVENPDSASPRVVAWGASGSGPQLAPYANALTGGDQRSADTTANRQTAQIEAATQPLAGTGQVVARSSIPSGTIAVVAADGTVLGSAPVQPDGTATITTGRALVEAEKLSLAWTGTDGSTAAGETIVGRAATDPAAQPAPAVTDPATAGTP